MPGSIRGGQGSGRSNQGGNNSGNQTGRSDKEIGSTIDRTKKEVARK